METKEIVGKIKYETKAGEKTMWINAGKLYIKDDGTYSVKINRWINPMAFANEKGECYFNVFDQKKKADAMAEPTVKPTAKPKAELSMAEEIKARSANENNEYDDLPF